MRRRRQRTASRRTTTQVSLNSTAPSREAISAPPRCAQVPFAERAWNARLSQPHALYRTLMWQPDDPAPSRRLFHSGSTSSALDMTSTPRGTVSGSTSRRRAVRISGAASLGSVAPARADCAGCEWCDRDSRSARRPLDRQLFKGPLPVPRGHDAAGAKQHRRKPLIGAWRLCRAVL